LTNFLQTDKMFKTYKQYDNGGIVSLHKSICKKQPDYKLLITIANEFAKQGKQVKIVPKLYYDLRNINDSSEYKTIFGNLIETAYAGKSPDLIIDGIFYEVESYIPPFDNRKISKMISRGAAQSSRIIINNTKGASDRFIRDNIYKRMKDKTFHLEINEVWLYEKGKVRLFYKNGGER